jgi:hypothetical protein
MKNINYIHDSRIVFSQWSGKNYAVFASLGRVVKIAALSVDICIQAVKKSSSVINSFFDAEYFRESVLEEYTEEITEIFRVIFGYQQLLPVVICSVSNEGCFSKLLNIKRY